MARGRVRQVLTQRLGSDGPTVAPDEVIVEEPMSIRLDDTLVATTMRTPGNDFELAAGFCHADGLLAGAPIRRIRYCATASAVDSEFNVVSVDTAGLAPTPTPRLTATSSSCGLCGSASIEELCALLDPLCVDPFDPAVLAAAPERIEPRQKLFAATGSVHAAASFDRDGRVLVVREDIGRHNAVDKVVGHHLLRGDLPLGDLALFVSGRVSFEIAQKAWAGGFAAVVAVSGPSALAVETARRANLQLAGFARSGRLNIYAPAASRFDRMAAER